MSETRGIETCPTCDAPVIVNRHVDRSLFETTYTYDPPVKNALDDPALLEILAAIAYEQWSAVLESEFGRDDRQFVDLRDDEKEYSRVGAREYLKAIQAYLAGR